MFELEDSQYFGEEKLFWKWLEELEVSWNDNLENSWP